MAQGLDINTVMGEAFQKALLKQNETYETYYAKKEANDKLIRVEELKRSGKWTDLEIEYRKEQSKLMEEYYDSLKQEILSERKTKQKLEEDFRREQRVASLNEIDLHNRLEKEYYNSLKKEILEERKEASKKIKEQEKLAEDYWKEQRVASLNAINLDKKYRLYLYKLGLKYEKEREAQVKKQLDQQNKYMSLAFSGVAKTATTAFEGLAQIAVLATASKIDALGSPEVAGILSLFSNEVAQGLVGVIGFAVNAWFQKAMFKSLLAKASESPQAGGLLARAGGAILGGAKGLAGGAMAGARGLATSTVKLGPAIFTAFRAVLPILGTVIGEALTAVVATLTSPLVLIVAGIATLVGIGYLVYKNWGWITKTLGNMWKWFQNSILNKDVLLNAFKLTPFGIFLDLIVTGFKTLTDLITNLPWFKEGGNSSISQPSDKAKDARIPTTLGGDNTIFGMVKNLLFNKGNTQAGDIIDLTKTALKGNIRIRGGRASDFITDKPYLQAGATESLLGVNKLLGNTFKITGGMGGKHKSIEHREGYGIDIGEIAGTLINKNVSMSTYTRNPAIAQFVKTMNQAGWYQPYPDDTVHWKYRHPSNKTTASEKLKAQSIKAKTLPKPTKPPVGKLPDPEVIYRQQQIEASPLAGAKELPPLPTTSPDKLSSASFNLNEINYRLNIVDQMNYGLYPQV